jgi:hypothetical protein
LFDCFNIFVALKKLPINFIQNTSVRNLRLGAIFFQNMINLSKETAQDSEKLLWKEKNIFLRSKCYNTYLFVPVFKASSRGLVVKAEDS